MAFSQWWAFSDGVVDLDKDDSGVYELGDANDNIVYIGSADKLKRRLKEHLSASAKVCIKNNAKRYRIDYRSDYLAEEKRLYDAYVKANGVAPKCNDISPPGP